MATIYGHESSYIQHKETGHRNHALIAGIGLVVIAWLFITLVSHSIMTSFFWIVVAFFLYVGIMKFISRYGEHEIDLFHKADRGLMGENDVALELEKLPDSYSVFRNVKLKEGLDIDFVVVGPNGVFAVEVKSHRGRIGYDGKELTINSLPFKEKDVLRQAKREALDVHEYLSRQLNRDIFVTPIIAFSSDYASLHFGMKQVNHVYVVQKKWLLDCITKMSGAVSDCEKINEALRSLIKETM